MPTAAGRRTTLPPITTPPANIIPYGTRDANGYIGQFGVPGVGKKQFAGWGFQLMPYLQLEVPYKQGAKESIAARTEVLTCPSRGDGVQRFVTAGPYVNNPSEGGYFLLPGLHACTDYASARVWDDPQDPVGEFSGMVVRAKISTGIVPPQPQFSLLTSTIVAKADGLSNTILFGEKRMDVRRGVLGNAQSDDDQGFTSGWDWDVNRSASIAPAPDYTGARDDTPLDRFQFGSSHPGGLNVVFGDASMHWINYGISRAVFEQLGGWNNGPPTGEY